MAPSRTRRPGKEGRTRGFVGVKGPKFISRKKRRQQERANKKKRKSLHHSQPNQSETVLTQQVAKSTFRPSSTKSAENGKGSASSGVSNPSAPKKKVLSNGNDEKEISRLEKLLKIDKKKKRLPPSFHQDGLDCILVK